MVSTIRGQFKDLAPIVTIAQVREQSTVEATVVTGVNSSLTQGVLAVLCWYVRIWCGCALRPQLVWGGAPGVREG